MFNAPLHKRRSALRVHLSKELRKEHGKRALVVRKGDTVRVTSGRFKKRTGKVTDVNLRGGMVHVEGMTRKTAKGSEKTAPLHPSSLEITKLELKDEKRLKIMQRK